MGIPAGRRSGCRVHARGEDHRTPRRGPLQGNGDGQGGSGDDVLQGRGRGAGTGRGDAHAAPAGQGHRQHRKLGRLDESDRPRRGRRGGAVHSGGRERSVDERQGGRLRRTHDEHGRRPDPEAVRRQLRGAGPGATGASPPNRRPRRARQAPPGREPPMRRTPPKRRTPPQELNGLALLWAIFRDWLRGLFSKKAA